MPDDVETTPEEPPVEPPAAVSVPSLWPVTLGLAFVCGGLIGGIVVYASGWAAKSDARARPSVASAPPGESATVEAAAEPAPGGAGLEDAPGSATSLAPPVVTPPAEEVVEEAPPPDTSPAGLRATYGEAILTFRGEDAEGDPRPPAPAITVGEASVLVPLSAVEGTARGRVSGSSAGSFAVVGIITFDPSFDLALLAVDAPLPGPTLAIAGAAIGRPTEAVMLGAARGPPWEPAVVRLTPGAMDRFTGGPRLSFEHPSTFGGAAIDADGRLLGLVPAAAEPARPVHAAASWAEAWATAGGAPLALDAFLRSAGPGSPTSRVAEARKLLAQRRYHEAARLLLEITAAEPRLLDEVGEDLQLAALEAARAHLTAGAGPTALVLLTEVLARRPDDAEVWAARGRAHAVSDEVKAAIDAFVRAITLDPSREEAWRAEARGVLTDEVNRLHGRGLTDAAFSLLLDLRASFPGDGRLRMTAASLLLAGRRFAAAASLYDEAAVLDARVAAEAREGARLARDLAGGPGAIVIDFTPGSADVVVEARIDGRVTTRLVLDPTRDLSAVPHAVARGAGYSLASAPRVRWDADPTSDEVHVVELRSVVVAGVGTARVRAAVVDGQGGGADGVLGATFLARYRAVEDRSLGRMVLWPR